MDSSKNFAQIGIQQLDFTICADVENCHKEVGNLKTKIHNLELEQSDLKRRLNKAQRYKETLQDAKIKQTKLEFTLEKLGDKLEFVKDELDTCKIDLLGAKQIQVIFESFVS